MKDKKEKKKKSSLWILIITILSVILFVTGVLINNSLTSRAYFGKKLNQTDDTFACMCGWKADCNDFEQGSRAFYCVIYFNELHVFCYDFWLDEEDMCGRTVEYTKVLDDEQISQFIKLCNKRKWERLCEDIRTYIKEADNSIVWTEDMNYTPVSRESWKKYFDELAQIH